MTLQDIPVANWWEFVKFGFSKAGCVPRVSKRPLRIVSLCTGLSTEGYALHKLSVPFEMLLTCDLKDISLHIQRNGIMGHRSHHHYNQVFDLLPPDAEPHCLLHDQCCGLQAAMNPDILVSGFPCQPYSTISSKRHKPGGVVSHPAYPMGEAMLKAVDRFRPAAFLLENVVGFARPVQGRDHTPLEEMVEHIKEHGCYHVVAFNMQLVHWAQCTRDRTSSFFCKTHFEISGGVRFQFDHIVNIQN